MKARHRRFAWIAAGIAVLGIAGTPDYVLDVERENERLRTEIKRTTMELKRVRLASMDCLDAEPAPQPILQQRVQRLARDAGEHPAEHVAGAGAI